MSADVRVCVWCMHTITDACMPETVISTGGHELHYCDAPDHSCYSEHVPSGTTRKGGRDDVRPTRRR